MIRIPTNMHISFVRPPATAIALLYAISLWFPGVSSGQVITYDFNSLTPGSALVGQDSWAGLSGAVSPNVATGVGIDTSTVVSIGTASGSNPSEAKRVLFSAGTVASSNIVTLTFDLYSAGANTIELFGIGAPGAISPTFGIYQGNFAIRGQGFSTLVNAVNGSGGNIAAATGNWYQVESLWDLSANSGAGAGSFFIKNLTAGDTSFTELFFNSAQTQSTASLGITAGFLPGTWTTGYLRTAFTGGSGNAGYLDNLSVSVPEPNSVVLLLGTLPLAALVGYYRRRVLRGSSRV